MANGFGSMFIGVSGLQSAQNALNTTANNLANVDTNGYVRQSVFFTDRNYVRFSGNSAIGKNQSGLGVQIGDVIHIRDVFLDRLYRTTSGREAFYTATHEVAGEVEDYYQELEGQQFQEALNDFWVSFQELSKYPDDAIYQNLVIQKAQLFISRGEAVYEGLKEHQLNLNQQIKDNVKRVNDLGKMISELNDQISKIESGNTETAMTLRDVRDQALDELSGLVDITYNETVNGVVKVNVEGQEFISELGYHEIMLRKDGATGFVTPYWGYLSDPKQKMYTDVFRFDKDISSANQNDIGALKAQLLARGDKVANYNDILGVSKSYYDRTTDNSIMLRAQAQLDQLFHGIMKALNDAFCPNVAASDYLPQLAGGNTVKMTTKNGEEITIGEDTLILDMDHCPVGADEKLPPQELFVRNGTERYTEAVYTDPATGETKVYYVYNEEDPSDRSKQYTIGSVYVNEELILNETLLPHLCQNGDVNQALAEALVNAWQKDSLYLSPNDGMPYNFTNYYTVMVGEIGTFGNVVGAYASQLEESVLTVDNQRQTVIGVSSEEELTYMIKYQNAYNASSRFINVINEMLEQLITQMG